MLTSRSTLRGNSWEEVEDEQDTAAELTIAIEFPEKNQERTFALKGTIDTESIPLGPYLVNTRVTLPCAVDLSGTPALEAIGDCSISARSVHIDTSDLILRAIPRHKQKGAQGPAELFIKCTYGSGSHECSIVCIGENRDPVCRTYIGLSSGKVCSKDAATA